MNDDEERKAALERTRAALRKRAAIPKSERTDFPRPERFEGPPLGSDAEGNIRDYREKPDDEASE